MISANSANKSSLSYSYRAEKEGHKKDKGEQPKKNITDKMELGLISESLAASALNQNEGSVDPSEKSGGVDVKE